MSDCFHPFANSHRTKIFTSAESIITNGFYAGRNRRRNDLGIPESAIANYCHTGSNLYTQSPAVPKCAGANIGNTIPNNYFLDLTVVIAPRLFFNTAEIRHSSFARNGQYTCFRQVPGKPSGKSSACYRSVGLRIIRRNIAFRVSGNIMAGVSQHLFFGYGSPPMHLTYVVSGTHVSFGNHHAHIAYIEYDHSMNIIVYLQDIPGFYILK